MLSARDGIADGIALSKATLHKFRQNQFWHLIYSVLSIPFVAGLFYPLIGVLLVEQS